MRYKKSYLTHANLPKTSIKPSCEVASLRITPISPESPMTKLIGSAYEGPVRELRLWNDALVFLLNAQHLPIMNRSRKFAEEAQLRQGFLLMNGEGTYIPGYERPSL